MIFPDQAVRIVIATKPVDFRKGHDGLAAMAHAELGFAPKAAVMVVFRSKRSDRIDVLFWDGSGIVMIYKRLEQGGFAWPKVGDGVMRLSPRPKLPRRHWSNATPMANPGVLQPSATLAICQTICRASSR